MTGTEFKSVDEYIAAQPPASQVALGRVRCAIRAAAWGAEEGISYKIPAYTLHGAVVLYFAGWKQHYSIYPADDRLLAAFKGQLDRYKASKGTLRFPLSEPVPVQLIERIARFRANAVAERKQAKAVSPKQGSAARKPERARS
jgi:uncharacterized protein YdhG (YjbR/CyaY superfamily)